MTKSSLIDYLRRNYSRDGDIPVPLAIASLVNTNKPMFEKIFAFNAEIQAANILRPRKGVIIGLGQVGLACAYSLLIPAGATSKLKCKLRGKLKKAVSLNMRDCYQ